MPSESCDLARFMDQDPSRVAAFVHRCFQVHSISFDDFPPTPQLSDDEHEGVSDGLAEVGE